MDYREFDVPLSLQRYVRCVWRLSDPAPDGSAQVIWPDGCCELVVHLLQPMRQWTARDGWTRQAPALYCGQLTAAIRLAADAPLLCWGIRLQPAASALLAGDQLLGMRDQVSDLRRMDSAFGEALVLQTVIMEGDGSPESLWEFLTQHLLSQSMDTRIEAAIGAIQAADGDVRIEEVAAATQMSLRGFQQRFLADVGLRPKEFARVVRLQASLRLLDSGQDSLAEVAADAGFADQAHATRELRRLTGHTPARLLSALREQRDGDQTLAMAAAFVRGFS